MKTTRWKSLAVVVLLVGLVSVSALAAPSFTDQDIDNGYVNPRDTVVVMKVKIVDGSSTINSVWLRNLGVADERDIVRIVIDDDADPFTAPLGEYTTLTGLRTGITLSLGYAVPNGTSYLWIGVEIAAAGRVTGGEDIQFQVRFYSGAYTSGLVTDGSEETIFKGAFEKVGDNALSAGYLNPGDANVRVQQATFTDDDGNNSGVGITKVSVSNTGNADETDITNVKVDIIVVGAITYSANKAPTAADWGSGNPLEFTAAEFAGMPAMFADDAVIVVRVRVTVGGTTDKHEIKTQVVLRTQENGEAYDQSVLATRTQTIRVQGLEAIRDVSADIPSGVLGPEENLVQEVTVTDDDVNAAIVTINGIWIKNKGNATKDDLEKIVVKRGAITLFTLLAADIVDFSAGHRYTGGDGFTPTVLTDDDTATLSVEYTIDGTITDGCTLQPEVYFWATENAADYESDKVMYPKSIVIHPNGLEEVNNVIPPNGGTAYSGQRVLVQIVACEDLDENTNNVRINPIRILNVAEGNRCSPAEVEKIEIRNEAGDLLGQTTDLAGLNTGGVAISTLQNNVVADNGEIVLHIYATFSGPEDVTAGHTLKLETTVFSEEDGRAGENVARGAEWALAINHRPVPNFTFAAATTTAASIGPKADFTYEQTIQFTAMATDPDDDDIASWAWDFGDETTSSEQNPTHSYPNGGTFTVTLTVTDARGATGLVSKAITVEEPPNVAPTVDFTWSPQAPATDVEVTFTAIVTDSDQLAGTAHTYAWDFGETPTSTAAAPTHAFTEKKTYTVKVTVTDAEGGTGTAEHTISVGNEKPVATFTASTTTPSTGDPVEFIGIATDPNDDPADTPFTYAWNFGDGVTSTAQNPSHTYTIAATRTVTLIVTDSRGAVSDASTATITVAGPARVVMRGFPNPASTTATIEYFLPTGATDPELWIFDLNRNQILRQILPAGGTEYEWSLRDEAGTAVSNGLYFCMITATSDAGRTITSDVFRLLVAR